MQTTSIYISHLLCNDEAMEKFGCHKLGTNPARTRASSGNIELITERFSLGPVLLQPRTTLFHATADCELVVSVVTKFLRRPFFGTYEVVV